MSRTLESRQITKRDLARGRNLRIAGIGAPVVLTALPIILFFVLGVLLSGNPIFAVSSLLAGVVLGAIGLTIGLGISGFAFYRHQQWTAEMRERIAAQGIGAGDIPWFRKELRPAEKRALKALKAADPLMEDAYRETLASRLTASRIIRVSRKELSALKRREAKLKSLRSPSSGAFLERLGSDHEKIESIHNDAKSMLVEAESRLEMIEAAAARGGSLSDSEVALKKLAARAEQLPLALEAAILQEQAVLDLEREDATSESDNAEPILPRDQ